MKNILVPVGSNDHALNTLQYAIDFAEAVEAKIYFFFFFLIISWKEIVKKFSKRI